MKSASTWKASWARPTCSISDIMREAMEYFAANYGQIEAQRKAA